MARKPFGCVDIHQASTTVARSPTVSRRFAKTGFKNFRPCRSATIQNDRHDALMMSGAGATSAVHAHLFSAPESYSFAPRHIWALRRLSTLVGDPQRGFHRDLTGQRLSAASET